MATTWLWPDTKGFGTSTQGFGASTWGNRFRVTVNCQATRMRWYKKGTSPGERPTNIRLWRADTQAMLADVAVTSDSGQAGWQTLTIPTPVDLVAYHEYRVSIDTPGNSTLVSYNLHSGPLLQPKFPAQWIADTYTRCFLLNQQGYPSTYDDTNQEFGVDCEITFDSTAVPPAETSIGNDLAAWLDTNDGTQANSAPLLTHAQVTDSGHGLAAIASNIGDVFSSVGSALHSTVGGIASTLTSVSSTLTTVATNVTTLLNRISADLITLLNNASQAVLDFLNGLGGPLPWTQPRLHNDPPVPGPGWTLVNETDWDTELAWDVPADVYVITVTTIPASQEQIDVAGVNWIPRVAWWCQLNGTHPGERHFLDFELNEASLLPVRCPGILLHARVSGTLGHIQAWTVA
jgi:hypothetical protein